MKINHISIENFKSIKNVQLSLENINILIGANGAGKSNFIQFFNLLNSLAAGNLQNYVALNGGADNFLYFGRKVSGSLSAFLSFGKNDYLFELAATSDNKFFFSHEKTFYQNPIHGGTGEREIANANTESNLYNKYSADKKKGVFYYILQSLFNWRVYHFHDTSITSKMKHDQDINDNRGLRRDASNIASFLFLLQEQHKEYYLRIEETIKLIAPFFERFQLQPLELNKEKIKLEWKHVGSDEYFNANHLSDGTLRMICLITLLLQPNLPDTIIIDEPELGLHPAAIELLSSIIKSVAAQNKQVICSTQSVTFLNHFKPEDIVVVNRSNGESLFKRLNKDELTDWLNEYAIGELWLKNVLGGRP